MTDILENLKPFGEDIETWHAISDAEDSTYPCGQPRHLPDDHPEKYKHGATSVIDKINCLPCLRVWVTYYQKAIRDLQKVVDRI